MIDEPNLMLDEEDFDTILTSDIEFDGFLSFSAPFLIKGKVKGQIDATGALVIAEGAIVEANIKAPSVIVRGDLTGNVTATKRVEISSTGRLTGDIDAPELFIQSGCVFNGACRMAKKTAVSGD